jgi:hypothetical protein
MSYSEEEAYRQFEKCLDKVLRALGPALPSTFRIDRRHLFEESKSAFLNSKDQGEFMGLQQHDLFCIDPNG